MKILLWHDAESYDCVGAFVVFVGDDVTVKDLRRWWRERSAIANAVSREIGAAVYAAQQEGRKDIEEIVAPLVAREPADFTMWLISQGHAQPVPAAQLLNVDPGELDA